MQNFKRVITSTFLVIAAVFATGCASSDKVQTAYYEYLKADAEARRDVGRAKYEAEKAKHFASALVLENADSSAKAAGSVALALSGNSGANKAEELQPNAVAAPESGETKAFRWANLLLNGVVPVVIDDRRTQRQAEVAIIQSNNAASVQKDTNNTMLGLGLGSAALQTAAPFEFSGAGLNVKKTVPPAAPVSPVAVEPEPVEVVE